MRPGPFEFELNNNHIYVRVLINRSGPFWFILDTGGSASTIDMRRARDLGMNPRGSARAVGAGEDQAPVSFVEGVTLGVDGVELRVPALAALHLKNIEQREGRTLDGVLGFELFANFAVTIDYEAKLIRLSGSQPSTASGHRMPLSLLFDRIPTVQAQVVQPAAEPTQGTFAIDTGASAGLIMAEAFHRRLAPPQQAVSGQIGLGVGGESKGLLGRIAALRFADFEIAAPLAGFSNDSGGAFKIKGLSGLIGGEILRRFRVTLDYQRKLMDLEPNSDYHSPYESDMFGAVLVAAGEGRRLIKVQRVLKPSPASEGGVSDGDIIAEIDGRSTSEFTLDHVRRMFRNEGREYALLIKRVEEVLQFRTKVKLRRLI